MYRIQIVGNPNVGKSTLFNSLTRSNEHTGNFHGVTVESKHKIVKYENEEYDFVDLPGLYSLNSFSFEEEVARDEIIKKNSFNLVIVDANSIRRNLYLCVQLNELNINYQLLINNYDYFEKHKNKLNLKLFNEKFHTNAKIINAKKIKINKIDIKNIINSIKNNDFQKNSLNSCNYLSKYIEKIKNKYNLDEKTIIFDLNSIFLDLKDEEIKFIKSFFPEIIRDRYKYIDDILKQCIEIQKGYVYGESKFDKVLINPAFMSIMFLIVFFLSIYIIFFLLGPFLSDLLIGIVNFLIVNPVINIIYNITDNVWVIEFISNGVFSSFLTVLTFLPQVCLLFIFLSILEDSGIISRMAYVFDDFLSYFGLNGKAVYIILMGLGCNTMSTVATRNMNSKNLRIKTAILNPYISCMARLPIYVIVASAFFGAKAYFVITGLYLLGLVVALVVAYILNKTILKSKSSELLLEFPPLRTLDCKHIFQVGKTNAWDMIKRIFGIVVSVGIIVWILSHTMFNLKYTDVITDSILFCLADKISFIFTPIGLNSAGVVCGLIVGIMAKELMVSTFSISNNVASTAALIASIVSSTSVVNFTVASASSFLVFSLLYCPCVSNLAVIKKEIGSFWMWFSIISQFTIAYMFSFVVYNGIVHGFTFALISILIITVILWAIIFITKKIRKKKLGCTFCNKNCGKGL